MLLCRSIAEVHRHRDKPFQSISAPNQHTPMRLRRRGGTTSQVDNI